MAAFRIGGIVLGTLEDLEFANVLQATEQAAGGAARFPALHAMLTSDDQTEPFALMDELALLASTEPGQQVAILIGTLRDDLMAAVAAADEG
jgi:hypothetical protein